MKHFCFNMNRRIMVTVLLAATTALGVMADATIRFSTTTCDLGNIRADGGKVTFEYPFENTGDEPLVIVSVSNGGCGCTRPDFPKAPIAPGESSTIKVSFDPWGRSGEFRREIKVRSNAKTTKLKFRGVVVPQASSDQ